MLTWIIQIIFISILFIFLVHHLIHFLKNTLTSPKMKDLISSSNKKYENIYSVLNSNLNVNENINSHFIKEDHISFHDGSDIQSLPIIQDSSAISSSSMKDELKFFLKTQLNNEL